ncbi:unnamed protein product [Auanema sp. JU1783]|nr:unnamed protein product [Auanema sp. JU1783]
MPRWRAPLEEPWANIIGKYTLFVARHPWWFIIIPTIFSAIFSLGILSHFHIVRGVRYLYSPVDALWKGEESVLMENWAADDQHFYPGKDVTRRRGLYLILKTKNGENILSPEHSGDVIKAMDWVINTRFLKKTSNESFTYKDVCLRFQNECFTNQHVRLIADIFSNVDQTAINVSYPTFRTKFATEPIDLTSALGNVTVDKHGHLSKATAWLLLYQLKGQTPEINELSSQFENVIADHINKGKVPVGRLSLFYFHSDTFDQELSRENKRITPKFAITFTVLIIFSIFCTFTTKWVVSKPWMGIVGVVSTLLAIISSTGLLLLLDVQFVDMCTVMPFLSLTIGIDDTFLMLASWHETDRTLNWEKRLEQAMKHAAVSISITSLTDTLAFLIGAMAPLPAVMYFCYYSSAAICFIFIYCLTIFTAFLSLQAKWEEKSQHCLVGINTKNFSEHEKADSKTLLLKMGTRPVSLMSYNSFFQNNNEKEIPSVTKLSLSKIDSLKKHDGRMWYQKFFEDKYASFIVHPFISAISFGLLCSYVFFTYLGTQRLVVGFDLINIVQKSSISRSFLETRDILFPEDVTLMDVAVMSPPNMADEIQRNDFMKVLEKYESTFCSVGRNSTMFWFFAYKAYIDDLGFGSAWDTMSSDIEQFNENLKSFLISQEKWKYDVLEHSNNTMRAFRFSTKIRNISDDEHAFNCAMEMRRISSQHPQFNLTTYAPLWNIADQFDIMWPQTMQDLYISILVMIPVSLLFIPQPLCAIAISLNIASIALGVLGMMAWIGVNLDATSMITIAMSVGFSVDFAAHVSYAYMTADSTPVPGKCNAEVRLSRTLGTVGWPVTQASLSVLLGVSSLAFVDSYVVQTCFKTVVLVITCGTTHALLFLPLVLMHVHKAFLFFRRFRRGSVGAEK